MWSACFQPQVTADTRVLILGSMPGKASLEQVQYYAHPRNAFWVLMEAIFAIDKNAPYHERLALLNAAKVGLWDVYAGCYRAGSLDASINRQTATLNDFSGFFSQYPDIHAVFFNGREAEKAFAKVMASQLEDNPRQYYVLPSTSPANAGITYQEKLKAWQHISKVINHD